MRPAQRYAEHGGEVGVVKAVPQVQLNDLALARLQLGEHGVDQPPLFGLFEITVDACQAICSIDRVEDHGGVDGLAGCVGGLIHRVEDHGGVDGLAGCVGGLIRRVEDHGGVDGLAGCVGGLTRRVEDHGGVDGLAVGQILLTCLIRLLRRLALSAASRHPRPEAAQAFPAGDRVQPRAKLRSLWEVARCCGGDDEGVPQRLGRVRRLAQHALTVVVEGSGVLVVRHGDARRVVCRDRRDRLAVVHGPHGS